MIAAGDPAAAAAEIDAGLTALHGRPDGAGALSALHARAAAMMPDPGARRFHLTHAWVFALEAGDAAADALEAALRAAGGLREPPAPRG